MVMDNRFGNGAMFTGLHVDDERASGQILYDGTRFDGTLKTERNSSITRLVVSMENEQEAVFEFADDFEASPYHRSRTLILVETSHNFCYANIFLTAESQHLIREVALLHNGINFKLCRAEMKIEFREALLSAKENPEDEAKHK